MKRMHVALAVASAMTLSASALGGVVITSLDGMWTGTLDPNFPGGGTGQLTNFSHNFGATDNLFETLWYEASNFTGGLSTRIEDIYTNTGSFINANDASFSLMRADGQMTLDVFVQMLDGANGGANFTLAWTYLGTGTEQLRGFAYADLDVDQTAGGDDASWNGTSVVQSDAPVTIYFGGKMAYDGWEIDTFANLRNALDGGIAGLANAGSVVNGDATAALSGSLVTLAPGDTHSLTFQLGGEVIPVPGSLALLAVAGLAGPRRRRR